jgi:hypothetical protein
MGPSGGPGCHTVYKEKKNVDRKRRFVLLLGTDQEEQQQKLPRCTAVFFHSTPQTTPSKRQLPGLTSRLMMIPRIPVGCLLFSAVAFALFALVARIYVSSRARRRGGGLRYPPGPRGLPLFGNIFDIPQYSPWETYTRWGKRYGTFASGDEN